MKKSKNKNINGVMVLCCIFLILGTVVYAEGMEFGGFDVEIGTGEYQGSGFGEQQEPAWSQENPVNNYEWNMKGEPEDLNGDSDLYWEPPQENPVYENPWNEPLYSYEQGRPQTDPYIGNDMINSYTGQGRSHWSNESQEQGIIPTSSPEPTTVSPTPTVSPLPTEIPLPTPTITPSLSVSPSPSEVPEITPSAEPPFTYYRKAFKGKSCLEDELVEFKRGISGAFAQIRITIQSKGAVRILSFRVNKKEIPWHWEGNILISDTENITPESEIELLALTQGQIHLSLESF